MNEIVVLGIGNILQKDDGIGVHIVNALMREKLPFIVKLIDGGTCTLDTLSLFLDYPTIFVIDCLRGGLKPGTAYKITPEQIPGYAKENLSLHDIQILDVIDMAKRMGKEPRVVIYGIEPEDTSLGLEMTETLEEKLGELTHYIRREIETYIS